MDITAQIMIAAAPARVEAVMFDPANDPRWIGGAASVEQLGDPRSRGGRVR